MIRKTFLSALLTALVAAFAFAQEAQKSPVKVAGFLLDAMCASGIHDDEEEVKQHKVSCALMPGCAKSGYVVVAGDKSYKLDAQGNKFAAEVLKNTKTLKAVRVEVEGTIKDDTLHVDKLAEAY